MGANTLSPQVRVPRYSVGTKAICKFVRHPTTLGDTMGEHNIFVGWRTILQIAFVPWTSKPVRLTLGWNLSYPIKPYLNLTWGNLTKLTNVSSRWTGFDNRIGSMLPNRDDLLFGLHLPKVLYMYRSSFSSGADNNNQKPCIWYRC